MNVKHTSSFFHLLLLLLLLAAAELPLLRGQPTFDYPSAKAPTTWTNSPTLPHTIPYNDGTTIKALLLRSPPERYGPSFAFGFLCRSATPSISTTCSRYLLGVFILYTNSGALITSVNLGVPQLVWAANRRRLVGENATLHLDPRGGLLLRDADGTAVWSANTTGTPAASLSLSAAGNLAVLDSRGRALWQSFDHPTDSLVPGQRLADGQSLRSNVSYSDAGEGLYMLTATATGFAAAVATNPPQIYYLEGSAAAPSRTGNYLELQNGSLALFRRGATQPVTRIPLPEAPGAQYLRLDLDGHLRLYQWHVSGWAPAADVIRLPAAGGCGFPTACGAYGVCSSGQCSCPAGSAARYFRPVSPRRPDLGCRPVTAVTCSGSARRRMVRLDDVRYFGYADRRLVAASVKEVGACAAACMRQCACKGAFFQYGSDPRAGTCYLVPTVMTIMDHDPVAMHYNSTGFLKVQG